MKNNILLVLCAFCVSCSTNKNLYHNNLIGKFYGKSEGFSKGTYDQYNLELKQDSLFYFNIKIHDANPKCEGIWSLSKDTLLLRCNDVETITDMLSSGYMNIKEHKLKIINKKKLKYEGVILKRKN